MKIRKSEILQFLEKDLMNRASAWLKKMNNPLASEIDFIDQEIALYERGLDSAAALHNKHHHTHNEVSVMQNEIVNFNNRIRVAEKWKSELSANKKAVVQPSFESYLTDEGKRVLPKLVKVYKDQKPEYVSLGLWAMHDLTLLLRAPDQENVTRLHKALSETFGDIGTRQGYSTSIKTVSTDYYAAAIKFHKGIIKGL